MWVEELNNNIIVDLNATFEESLESWFYVITEYHYKWDFEFTIITKDWQYYSFMGTKDWELTSFSPIKNVSDWDNRTIEEDIDEIQQLKSHYNMYSNEIDTDKIKEFKKSDLENLENLRLYLLEFTKKDTKNDVETILNDN